MLHEFLESNRDEILGRVAGRGQNRCADGKRNHLHHGIPVFLSQMTTVLGGKAGATETRTPQDALTSSATANGEQQLLGGLSVEELVHAYGDVCQVVTELATEQGVPISTQEFKAFNGCLDDATAHAVTEYVAQRERSLARADTERLGLLAHEMRNHLSAAMLSFESIRSGQVGVAGHTSEIHARSLVNLRDLVDQSLAEVRLDAHLHSPQIVDIAELVEDIKVTATLQAKARDIQLRIVDGAPDLRVKGDRQTIAAVIANLVQNAIKFTKPSTEVVVRTGAAGDRIIVEVEDSCGGIGNDKLEALFAPFSQQSSDRTGLGLGLSICRRGAAANGGEVRVRDLPGHGCVFTLDLPRFA